MSRPSPLTRRELLAAAGLGAAVLVLGEGILSSDAVNRPLSLAEAFGQGDGEATPGTSPDDGSNRDTPDSPPEDAKPSASPAEEEKGPSAEAAETTPSPEEEAAERAAMIEALPWNLRLVNKDHPLPKDFKAPKLRELSDGYSVDARIYDDLTALLKAAEKAGRRPVVCSAYRTHKKQRELYRARVRQSKGEGKRGQEARDDAAFWVAPPYASEHEAAIAVDLVDSDYQELDKKQERTKTQKWLMAHCAKYGFILRYPTDKSAATGIGYEPWHYRYVGKEAASAITESGLCFEEWLEEHLPDLSQ